MSGRSDGGQSGHVFAVGFICLTLEAAKQLWGIGGYLAQEMGQHEVAYAGISGVAGHHGFGGCAILVGGGAEKVSKLRTSLQPFDNDYYNSLAELDLHEQEALTGVRAPVISGQMWSI